MRISNKHLHHEMEINGTLGALMVAGVFVSPRAGLAALCCAGYAAPQHVLLAWLAPPAGVLTWALEAGIAARAPGVFMLMALWLWPDALAVLARFLAHRVRPALAAHAAAAHAALTAAFPGPVDVLTRRAAVHAWNATAARLRRPAHGCEYRALRRLVHGDLCPALNASQLAALEHRLLAARALVVERVPMG